MEELEAAAHGSVENVVADIVAHLLHGGFFASSEMVICCSPGCLCGC